MTAETADDLATKAIAHRDVSSAHPLEQSDNARVADNAGAPEAQANASWEQLPAEQLSADTANVNVYLDNFVSVVQGGPKERHKLLWHLFHKIDRLFCSNEEADTDRKEPISLNKLGQGNEGLVQTRRQSWGGTSKL